MVGGARETTITHLLRERARAVLLRERGAFTTGETVVTHSIGRHPSHLEEWAGGLERQRSSGEGLHHRSASYRSRLPQMGDMDRRPFREGKIMSSR